MKKMVVFAAFAAVACLFAGCDKTPAASGEGAKKLSVSVGSIGFEIAGGSEEVEINASSGLGWSISSDREWIKVSPEIGTGIGTVLVSAEANASYETRTATLTVTAEGVEPVGITVTQTAAPAPSEDAIKLKTVNCYYAGDFWGTDGKLDDVYFEMTDMSVDAEGKVKGPGTAICLDINVAAATFSTFSIDGTYLPSALDMPVDRGTFNVDAAGEISPTYVNEVDENGSATRKDAVGGKVTIVKSGGSYIMDIELTFKDGTSLTAYYDGPVTIYDDTVDCKSTLTGDISVSFGSAKGTFSSWGVDGIASDALVMNFSGDGDAELCDYMTLTLNVAKSAWNDGNIAGTYEIIAKSIEEIYTSELVPGTAIPGYMSNSGDGNVSLGGGWYYSLAKIGEQSQIAGMAPFVSGTVKIEGGAGNSTVTFTFVDDNPATPHTVSGKYTGPIVLTNQGGGTVDPDPKPEPDPEPDPDPDPDPKPDPDRPLIDIVAGAGLGQFTDGGRW